MAKTTFSVTFYCRPSKVNKQGLSPLELCINVNQERVFINLPTKFYPKDFNKKRKPKEIDEIINQYRYKVNEVISELLDDDMPITASTLKEYFKTGGKKSKTLKDVCDEYLSMLKNKTTDTAFNKYKLAIEFLYTYISPSTQITTIKTSNLIHIYDLLKQHYMLSTAGGYFTKIKSIFCFAYDSGYIKSKPYTVIRVEKPENKVEYLTEDELNTIKNLELEDYPRLEKVRDLMLFQASIGTAYVDMVSLDVNKIKKVGDVYTYSDKRHKTGIAFTSIILPDGIRILEKYNYTLPMISNQKYNKYLKEIQRLAKIETIITSHILRKTYGTYLLNKGVNISVIAKTLGHKTIQTTQKYYVKTTEEFVADEIGKIIKGSY